MAYVELRPGVYYYGWWWVAWKGTDWLACAWKEDGQVHGVCRFRYYLDKLVFGSVDRKSGYKFDMPGSTPDEDVIARVTSVAQVLALASLADEAEFVRVCGDHEQALAAIEHSPWAHVLQAQLLSGEEP